MPQDSAEIWSRIQAELRRRVTDTAFELWLSPLHVASFEGDVLLVEAPGPVRGWVADRFATVLDEAAVAVLGPRARVEIAGEGPRDRPPELPAEVPRGAVRDELNPKFTFEQFVLGDGNRFAHAAALAVAEQPAGAYNPLFLYGPPGVGKTHLLQSIGNYVRAHGGGLTVRCTTAEAFTNGFLSALHGGGNVEHFKEHFRGVDVLLIDDVQFLQSKARTEEEFFHTFNALHDAGSQVVLTSDRLPRNLASLEDRLRERFEAGLVADIRPPDLATRLTVLRKRIQHDEVDLPDEGAIEVIARRIDSNMRALEGALIRVVAFHSLTDRPIDAELAEEVLDGLYPAGARCSRGRAQRRVDPAGHVRAVRPLVGGAPVERACHARGLAAPARHVPLPQAHRGEPPGHRSRLRWSQPHDRPPRLPPRRRACRFGPRRVGNRSDVDRTHPCRPAGLTDCERCGQPRCARACRKLRPFRRSCTHQQSLFLFSL